MKLTFNLLLIALVFFVAACGEKPRRHTTIAVLGDSLVAGYQIQPEQAFPAVLEAKLKENKFNVTVINNGISGNTSADGLARLDSVIAEKPDLVIIELGANDMLQHVDPQATSSNLEQIIKRLQDAKIAMLLTGMRAPADTGLDFKAPYDLLFPLIAQKYNVPLYPYFLEPIALNPQYNLPDMIHPNPEGVKQLVDSIYPTVTRAIGSLQ